MFRNNGEGPVRPFQIADEHRNFSLQHDNIYYLEPPMSRTAALLQSVEPPMSRTAALLQSVEPPINRVADQSNNRLNPLDLFAKLKASGLIPK